MKKTLSILLTLVCIVPMNVFANEVPSADMIHDKALEFASQYPYKDGDSEKSFSETYAEREYTSGIETRYDGVTYECPAVYHDEHAQLVDDYDLQYGRLNLTINNNTSKYSYQSVLYNSVTMVPIEVFEEAGCTREYNEYYYVTKLRKNNTTLEIIPYLIGMRKDGADGFWVPIGVCARYIGDNLYVPVRAVAEELGITVGWDGSTQTVSLTSDM